MLGRIWRWVKRLFLRLIGKSSRSALPGRKVSVAPPVSVKIRKPLTDAEYESLFLELLAGVHEGWSRGSVKGFLAAKEIHESALLVWLRGFGERLLNSPASHQEIAARMVQLGGLDIGEVGKVAGDIGLRLLKMREDTACKDTKNVEEFKEGELLPTPEVKKFVTLLPLTHSLAQPFSQNIGIETNNSRTIVPGLINKFNIDDQITDVAAYFFASGIQQINAGDFISGIASFDKVIAIHPNNSHAWSNRGWLLHNLERYEEALISIDKALEFEQDHYEAWNHKGVVLYDLGRYEEALASYAKALKFKPDFHHAWNNRGLALFKLERYEEALASYAKALKFKPDFYHAWNNRGLALFKLERYEEAIASFDKALEIQPDSHRTWNDRGLALAELERYEEAIASYRKALEFNPNYDLSWYHLGLALFKLKRYEEAVASHDKALKFKPDFHQALNDRGLALDELEQYEDAIASYRKALEFNPNYHLSWYNWGLALFKLERYEKAITFFDKALELKLDYDSAWGVRGLALMILGQYEDAIASYRKTVELNPKDYLTLYNWGSALYQLWQNNEAIIFFDKVLELKLDYYYAWISRGDSAIFLTCSDSFLTISSSIAKQNPHLNQAGNKGALANYKEGLKYCPQDTHPEGWGRLHQAIGNAHYFQGRSTSCPRSYWYEAANSYNTAQKTLTAKDFPKQHLEVLQDLIRVRLNLGETDKAEELQRRGTDVLQNLLDTCKSPGKKQQLALKFAGFQQLTVDIAVQSGNWGTALELAEKGKNVCLHWLFGLDNVLSFPKWRTMQSLLNPTTAIVYWHLSPAALHTFILKHDLPSPIVISTSTQTNDEECPASLRRLQLFEEWLKDWNQQYSDYRLKDEKEKSNHPWRVEMPTRLENLKNILCIPAIEQHLQDITQLILIPHRDLHRFPLHILFSPKFSITYLPSALLGLTLQKVEKSAFLVFWCKWYFKLQHDQFVEAEKLDLWFISLAYCLIYGSAKKFRNDTDYFLDVEAATCEGFEDLGFAGFESEAISAIFPHATRIEGNEVTKNQVETVLSSGRHTVFHFAGHGSYNFQSPKQSALILSGTEKLTLENIRQNNFPGYKLVSLSACETGVTSNQTITTEYVGLVSGFLSQGVAHVVSTLWTVQSTTSALVMIEFYRRWRSGVNAVDALGEATTWLQNLTIQQLKEWYKNFLEQLSPDNDRVIDFIETELWKLEKLEKLDTIEPSTKLYAHPYYWAAFTITGNAFSHERLR